MRSYSQLNKMHNKEEQKRVVVSMIFEKIEKNLYRKNHVRL